MAGESQKGKKQGIIKKKCRRFCTGISPIRLRLGKSEGKHINASNQIGAIYIPSKFTGSFMVSANEAASHKRTKVRLYYKNGKFANPPTSEEIRDGKNVLGDWQELFKYDKPEGQIGWYFVEVFGTVKAIVRNTFQEQHSLKRTPWNSWYWPGALAKPPHLYDKKGKIPKDVIGKIPRKKGKIPRDMVRKYIAKFAAKEDGPLIKYDRFTNQLSETASSARKDWEIRGVDIWPKSWQDPLDRSSWRGLVGGHCDATAWAGFEEDHPPVGPTKNLKDLAGERATFSEQDRLGLITVRYWVGIPGLDRDNPELNDDDTTHVDFARAGKEFLKANWFHDKLRDRISKNIGGIQVHDTRNWNYGVFRYRSTFVGLGDIEKDEDLRQVEITTSMTYIDWITDASSSSRKWHDGPEHEKEIKTIYRLQFQTDGTIEKQLGPWKRDSLVKGDSGKRRVIEFVFWHKKIAPLINRRLDKTILESIYKKGEFKKE